MGSRHSKTHPGDAVTIISDGRRIRATFLKSTGAHVEVVVTNPDGSPELCTVAHALCVLGWYDAHGSRITATVDDLMHNTWWSFLRWSFLQAPTLVFCTLCYPYGNGTLAAFDLAPMRADCQSGSYVPVEVRLREFMQPRELLLAIYFPVRLHTVHQTPTLCTKPKPAAPSTPSSAPSGASVPEARRPLGADCRGGS